ncbi:MAG: hypothetical protein Q9162_007877 [Coniocarpon cinnabarinum]
MVRIEEVRRVNTALVQKQPLTAVCVGATSGIGRFTVQALIALHAEQKGTGLRVYIVGRNQSKGDELVSECQDVCPDGRFTFIQATDLALISDVDEVCAKIAENENATTQPKIDLLMLTQGGLAFGERQGALIIYLHSSTFIPRRSQSKLIPSSETSEGLTTTLSWHYYSRARFILNLLPLLRCSILPSSHVVSVFGAGYEGTLFRDDLGLRDPQHYSLLNQRSHVCYLTTSFLEKLAHDNAGKVSAVHVFPGLVFTDAHEKQEHPFWFKAVWRVSAPLTRLLAVEERECGERMLFLASERFPAASAEHEETEVKAATASATESPDLTLPASSPESSEANEGLLAPVRGTDGNVGSGAYACNDSSETVNAKKLRKADAGMDKEAFKMEVWGHTLAVFDAITSSGKYDGA